MAEGDRRIVKVAAQDAIYTYYHTYAVTRTALMAPISLTLSGYYSSIGDNQVSGVGNNYYQWQPKLHSSKTAAYDMFISVGILSPKFANGAGFGFVVRCVAQ